MRRRLCRSQVSCGVAPRRSRMPGGRNYGVRIAGRCERNLQACWPESNVLIERRYLPVSSKLDYNAVVKVEALTGGSEWVEQAAKTLTLLHPAVAQAWYRDYRMGVFSFRQASPLPLEET